jgi:hypothetical protein
MSGIDDVLVDLTLLCWRYLLVVAFLFKGNSSSVPTTSTAYVVNKYETFERYEFKAVVKCESGNVHDSWAIPSNSKSSGTFREVDNLRSRLLKMKRHVQ